MKSLELNWIKNEDKSLVMPEVVFSSVSWAGGLYYHPEDMEVCINGKFYSLEFGLIEIGMTGIIESTLAHEWRHHWQFFHYGVPDDYLFSWPQEISVDEYDKALVKYFLSNPTEMDALRFQYKHSHIYEEWEKLLYKYLWH